MNKPERLFVFDAGDPSVGIFASQYIIECPFYKSEMEQEALDWFKKSISNIYKEFCEGRMTLEYESEIKDWDE